MKEKEEIKKQILEEFKDINYAYNNCTKYDTLKRLLDELTEEEDGDDEEFMNYLTCPICGNLHDDGAFILTESGHTYFICFDCDEKYTGDRARKILEEKERRLEDGYTTENNGNMLS